MSVGPVAAGHIVLVLHDFASGGSELMAVRLANAWVRQGRRVTIVAGAAGGPSRVHLLPEVQVRAIAPSIARGLGSRCRLGRAVAPLVSELRPDVIVGSGNYQIPILGTLQRRLGSSAPPTVAKLSNPLTRNGRSAIGQYIFSRRLRHASAAFDSIVALAPALAHEASLVLARSKIDVLANPTLPDDWKPVAERTRSKTILCVGRLVAQKRFSLALQAFAHLDTSYRLVLLGEGPERESLTRHVTALGLHGRVAMPGFVTSVLPYLEEADALLVSARYEGYPNAILEALSQGVPVATTHCTKAIDDIMAHTSFGMIAPADPVLLGKALKTVATGPRPDANAVWKLLEGRRQCVAGAAWLELLDQIVLRARSDQRVRSKHS